MKHDSCAKLDDVNPSKLPVLILTPPGRLPGLDETQSVAGKVDLFCGTAVSNQTQSVKISNLQQAAAQLLSLVIVVPDIGSVPSQ